MEKTKKQFEKFSQFLKRPTTIIVIVFALMVVFFVMSAALAQADLVGTVSQSLTRVREAVGFADIDLETMILRLIQVVMGFLGLIAIIIILYGGFVWMLSGGMPDRVSQAKRILKNGVIGLAIIILAFAIVSFIFRILFGWGAGGPAGQAGPSGQGQNLEALGGGIIQSVYPAPFARDVPRDTMIYVTFREEMRADTIIDAGHLSDNVTIRFRNPVTGLDKIVEHDEVTAATTDDLTFIFRPQKYLGDGQHHIWYEVKLGTGIEKANGRKALSKVFAWPFEVGTRLDLVPPQVDSVFPPADNQADNYTREDATQATGSIRVREQPRAAQRATSLPIQAEITAVPRPANWPEATVSGNYTCAYDGTVTVTYEQRTNRLSVETAAPVAGLNTSAILTPGVRPKADLGCGLVMEFLGAVPDGARWQFSVQSERAADTLTISSRVYRFGQEIAIGTTAENIKDKINEDQNILGVTAAAAGDTVTLTAIVAGTAGNRIAIDSSGWADINWPTTRGEDAVTTARARPPERPDQPKNVLIQINFDEAMFVPVVAGTVTVTDADDDGVGANPSFSYITVQADIDNDGNFEDGEYAAGSWSISNQYKTVEFKTNKECGERNSCGDIIYCLPVAGNVTNYKVTVRAANLQSCDPAVANPCPDPKFNQCVDNHCNTGAPDNLNYPKAVPPPAGPDGVADAANNSLDGDKDDGAEGPPTDNYIWEFYVTDRVDLEAPEIVDISPAIGFNAVGLRDKPEAVFNKLLSSSSLKPGTGYRDGLCSCGGAVSCRAGESCDGAGVCKSTTGQQNYCQSNSECETWNKSKDSKCFNHSYVTLIQNASEKIGWWVENWGQDMGTCDPLTEIMPCGTMDDQPDRTVVEINHTGLVSQAQYAAEMGSGIRDIYQNCYVPSSSADCAGTPYCCEGAPSDVPCR